MTTIYKIETNFWLNDPKVLIDERQMYEIIPNEEMNLSEKLNAMFRFSIYTSLILILMRKSIRVLFIPIFVGIVTIFVNKNAELKETYKVFDYDDHLHEIKEENCRKPTVDNPLMNNLVTDIHRKDVKDPCKPTVAVKENIRKIFNENLFRDVSDIYESNNSQRQFYTVPGNFHGTNHGDTKEFANALYNTGETCKENTTKCIKGGFFYEDLRHGTRGEGVNYELDPEMVE